MDVLEIMVNEVYDQRNSYTDLDYLVIMNCLKEAYLKLTGSIESSGKHELCEHCCQSDIFEDGLCLNCIEKRDDEYSDIYIY